MNTSTVNSLDAGFLDNEQIGIVIPGDTTNFAGDLASDIAITAHSSLGETPSNTTFTIKYRIGGGISSNVAGNDLTLLNNGFGIISGSSLLPPIMPMPAFRSESKSELFFKKNLKNFKITCICNHINKLKLSFYCKIDSINNLPEKNIQLKLICNDKVLKSLITDSKGTTNSVIINKGNYNISIIKKKLIGTINLDIF